MLTNAKQITTIAIFIAVTSSIATYSWNNKTIEQQLEEQNTAILQDCLSNARMKQVPSEILEATSHCNKDLLKTIYSPSYSGTTGTANTTPVSSVPIWTIIPQASANYSVENVAELGKQKLNDISNENHSLQTNIVKNVEIIDGHSFRTPEQIYEQVKHLGYRKEPTLSIIRACKGSSLRPDHCILVSLTLMYNEAGNQQNSKACTERNNCFGIQSGKKKYSSLDEGMENWVQKYNKYWYKAEGASFFYSSAGNVSKSRYCTSESSSNSSVGCPHGLSIASDKWSKLYKLIY